MLQATSTPVGAGRVLSPALPRAATVIIRPAGRIPELELAALWHHAELLYFLVWRDIKVRYKQTAIGAGWAILNPVLTLVLFTAVFSGIANIPSDGVPYPIFAYTALLPWGYFSQALNRSGASLVSNAHLITKVYFPRLIIPISAVISPLVDLAVAFGLLILMMLWFRIAPGWGLLALPLFLLLCVVTALAVTLWLSALNVKYRDFGVITPLLTQLWLYASPVAYPVSAVPERWQFLYSLNPMVGVIEGFRWAILGKAAPDVSIVALNCLTVLVILCGGLIYFKRVERVFADIV